jgi:hypothetical protein
MASKILQVNFKLQVSAKEYSGLCDQVAQAFADVPGLEWKIWLLNEQEKEAGGIYLFESEHALGNFAAGPLAATVKSLPQLTDISMKTFDVMEQVTATTRGPVKQLATAG